MRDILINLLEEAEGSINNDIPAVEQIADYLISRGVIILPFPIGTTYYRIVTKRAKVTGAYFKLVREARLNWYNVESVLQDFGKSIFLSREEAKKALAEEGAIDERN